MSPDLGGDLLSRRQTADLLGVHVASVDRYIAEGRLRAYRVGARYVRVVRSDVLALLVPMPAPLAGALNRG